VNDLEHNTALWLKEKFVPELNNLRSLNIKFAGVVMYRPANSN
jgi:hypothetical protein